MQHTSLSHVVLVDETIALLEEMLRRPDEAKADYVEEAIEHLKMLRAILREEDLGAKTSLGHRISIYEILKLIGRIVLEIINGDKTT